MNGVLKVVQEGFYISGKTVFPVQQPFCNAMNQGCIIFFRSF